MSLAAGIRALYRTWVVDTEVDNVGFNQYYSSTDGVFASEAVAAFEYFGATEHAKLLNEANEFRAQELMEKALLNSADTSESLPESYEHAKLGPLDDRYYNLAENLSQLRVARIRQTPEQFTGN